MFFGHEVYKEFFFGDRGTKSEEHVLPYFLFDDAIYYDQRDVVIVWEPAKVTKPSIAHEFF